ncbi:MULTISPECIES: ClpXP protease specificity-enhancing factor [Brachymonas]|mgnify:FL=1|uniref:ClpXP protease specificity-enhancing factor n=1 Tax=Brachymonas TaxID=28219 RepID=UPI002E785B74|nr:ClpXP protease specificity-enhancing factor [Brachymonas sp. J145]MEE1653971.1 ClpXP protease specificity-enhancing factor [Brachymonas sp. J145]
MSEASDIRPYMIRAWHEWCTDNGFTPYLLVKVNQTVAVPREFVQNGEIVLNVDLDATGGLSLGNDLIRFKARFSGKVRDIIVPVDRVQAIYARENGQGMGFEVLEEEQQTDAQDAAEVDADADTATPATGLQVLEKSASEAAAKADDKRPAGKSGSRLRIVK